MSEQNGKHFQKGFIPVMLMPFNEKGEIDYDGLRELTEYYVQSGAVGLFANCLSSEMFELTPGEQLKSTRFVVETVAGRVPVVATGNFGDTMTHQADAVKMMYNTGVEAVILVTSLLAAEYESNDVFDENTRKLMDLTGNIPLGFYECPVPYKRLMGAEQLTRFLKTNRVVYYKDTSLDLENVRAKLEAGRGSDFKLYDAYLGHAVDSLRSGADGLSCIQGNFFPEMIVWVCRHYNNPEMQAEVSKVQEFLVANMDVMHAVYPRVAKYFLQKRGIRISTFSRTDGEPLTQSVKAKIDKLYKEYTEIRAVVNIG
jgi:4-hydroxy-tetrahydrodipicolinate synthase